MSQASTLFATGLDPAPVIEFDAGDRLLGARLDQSGCRFGLWAPRASRVELALINEDGSQTNVDMVLGAEGIWNVHVPGVVAEQRYGYRVHGDWDPDRGMRFNPAKLLLDPYARAITAGVDYSGPILDHIPGSNYSPDLRDSAESVPLAVVVADSAPPTPIAQRRPMSQSVIYETHVKGYTRLHPAVPEHLRGTYAGLAYPAVVQHLVDLGVTAVELLPVHHYVSEPFIVGRGLTNYWGYNSLGFFAPHGPYTSSTSGTLGGQVREFKQMVSALHEAGIEVILDVVYNHTGEGGHEGPTLSFRGIDHAAYYRLTHDKHNDYDVTGCGNSVDTSTPGVLAMVMDSLRYWVTEMGVDGFRFDLVTTLIRDSEHHVTQSHAFKQLIAADPVLKDIKIIAEPWDVGPYGYQVGNYGPGWSEWNDRFRGFARDFWRGATHGVQELATRLSGSPDLFRTPGRDASASINFVTAHDGFTLRDLVTYDVKHNEANGEANRDGSDDNRSWNHGWEGPTDDPKISAVRHRQIKNLMLTQIMATGVPMITAGDEMGRTQEGNHTADCQDGPLSWVHWDLLEDYGDVAEFTRAALALRAAHPVLRRAEFASHTPVLDAEGQPTTRMQLAWLNGGLGEMGENDWHDAGRTVLGMYQSDENEAFVLWFNQGTEPVELVIPDTQWGEGFIPVLSSWADVHSDEPVLRAGQKFAMPARSVCLMQVSLEPAPALEPAAEPDSSPEPDPA